MTGRTQQTLTLADGRRLGYAEYGDPAGTPIIFLQGTPSSRLMHPDETITAQRAVRLIVIDRPGFGLSDFQPGRTLLDWPRDLTEFADKLGIRRSTLYQTLQEIRFMGVDIRYCCHRQSYYYANGRRIRIIIESISKN